MATKIYRVAIRTGDKLAEHLVRANSALQAQSHMTREMIVTEVAEQEDILRLAQAGTKLVDATVAPAPAPPAPAPSAGSSKK